MTRMIRWNSDSGCRPLAVTVLKWSLYSVQQVEVVEVPRQPFLR